jgi:hypothetical protein
MNQYKGHGLVSKAISFVGGLENIQAHWIWCPNKYTPCRLVGTSDFLNFPDKFCSFFFDKENSDVFEKKESIVNLTNFAEKLEENFANVLKLS